MSQIKNISKKENLSLDNVCYLISQKVEPDNVGNQITIPTEKICFCSELPITSSERSNASVDGIKPEVCLVLDYESYDNQKKIKYNNITYSTYRKYPRSDGMVELYCEVKTGGK